jgi:hypothetical protein
MLNDKNILYLETLHPLHIGEILDTHLPNGAEAKYKIIGIEHLIVHEEKIGEKVPYMISEEYAYVFIEEL